MTNSEIAAHFSELAKLMELHGDNPFKIRSYRNAYNKLRKMDGELAGLPEEELQKMDGVGKAIAAKIHELATTGRMETLEKWREKTPPGVRQMLGVRGFGPKKVRAVWEGLGVDTVGGLLYAINENRLVELKGFGAKTQASLKEKLEFFQRSQGRFLYRDLEPVALALENAITKMFPGHLARRAGAMRRLMPTLSAVEILTTVPPSLLSELSDLDTYRAVVVERSDGAAPSDPTEPTRSVASVDGYPVFFYHCGVEEFGSKLFRRTGSPAFLEAFVAAHPGVDFRGLATEAEVWARAGIDPIPTELREDGTYLAAARNGTLPKLIEPDDVRGVVHAHSTYSDGIHTLRQMAEAARDRGYAYLVMSDHSRTAVYAGGLKIDRVREQWAEIDELNRELAPFRIYKSIESDILADGSLDYPDEVLAGFDLVIASVHSGLNMDEAKATERLLRAIRNPYTTILGHPTGRLLLSRAGYPLDHRAVIDACAEHGVIIELNANPYRLDLDWSWIPYASEKGVKISINPDAHSTGGIGDIRYGVLAARKGGLRAADCWNTVDKLPLG